MITFVIMLSIIIVVFRIIRNTVHFDFCVIPRRTLQNTAIYQTSKIYNVHLPVTRIHKANENKQHYMYFYTLSNTVLM